jgi:hypothetical protein
MQSNSVASQVLAPTVQDSTAAWGKRPGTTESQNKSPALKARFTPFELIKTVFGRRSGTLFLARD